LRPNRGKPVDPDGLAMKVLQQQTVERRLQLQRTDDAGDAQHLGTNGEAGYRDGKPKERTCVRNAGRTSAIAFHQRAQSEGDFSPLGLLPPTDSWDTIGTVIECSRLDLALTGFARWRPFLR